MVIQHAVTNSASLTLSLFAVLDKVFRRQTVFAKNRRFHYLPLPTERKNFEFWAFRHRVVRLAENAFVRRLQCHWFHSCFGSSLFKVNREHTFHHLLSLPPEVYLSVVQNSLLECKKLPLSLFPPHGFEPFKGVPCVL